LLNANGKLDLKLNGDRFCASAGNAARKESHTTSTTQDW
jgi:hypothetical protein